MANPKKAFGPHEAFARRLYAAITRKGMSASDLARAVWGTMIDNRGRPVAKNRDRVSHYLKGTSMPEPDTLKKLADALGVKVEVLQPAAAYDAPLEMQMTVQAGRSDLALLEINKVVSTELAAKIMAMVSVEKLPS